MKKPLLLLLFTLMLLVPLIVEYGFFRLPEVSDTFDCDDAVELMLDRLESLGVQVVPILGSLGKSGEAFWESDHLWVQASIGSLTIPFDWGRISLDTQHYEGFPITREQLRFFIDQDKK